jgi:plasmid stability protein
VTDAIVYRVCAVCGVAFSAQTEQAELARLSRELDFKLLSIVKKNTDIQTRELLRHRKSLEEEDRQILQSWRSLCDKLRCMATMLDTHSHSEDDFSVPCVPSAYSVSTTSSSSYTSTSLLSSSPYLSSQTSSVALTSLCCSSSASATSPAADVLTAVTLSDAVPVRVRAFISTDLREFWNEERRSLLRQR